MKIFQFVIEILLHILGIHFDLHDDAKRSKDSGALEFLIHVFKWVGFVYSCLDLASLFCFLFWAIAKKEVPLRHEQKARKKG